MRTFAASPIIPLHIRNPGNCKGIAMTAPLKMDAGKVRQSEHKIDAMFVDRWSPRAMTGEPIAEQELLSLFEAARWAPSSSNGQPWRFVYARRDTEHWSRLFELMIPFNQSWTKDAAALVVIVSRKNFQHNEKPNATHAYDTGAAWGYLALQGSLRGLVVHGMAGFDYDRARKELGVPEGFDVQAMAAIGKPGAGKVCPPSCKRRGSQRPQAARANRLRRKVHADLNAPASAAPGMESGKYKLSRGSDTGTRAEGSST